MKQKILTFASLMKNFLGVLLLLVLCSVAVFAYPQVGHQFYGYAGSGSTVTAKVDDLTYTASVQSNKYYGYNTLFFVEASSDDTDGAEEGDTITFYLDGTAVTTSTFEIGGVTKVDFADDPATSINESIIVSAVSNTTNTTSSPQNATATTSDDDDSKSSSSSSKKKSSSTSNTTDKDAGCSHKWKCTNWNTCAENGFQTRTCYYTGNCTAEGNQSDTRQRCTYIAPEKEPIVEGEAASCYDNTQNQGERGIDCGGPCPACPTTIAPVEEEPKTNWLYIGLGLFIILLIIAVILAHKYKDKLLPYWEKFKSKIGIKPKVVQAPAAKPVLGMQQRPVYPQQYQQYMYRK